jgi:hypothetical protein
VNKRLPEATGQPRWLRLLINLGGVAVIGHETVVSESPRWPLLLVAIVMMGLASADLLDRYLPGPRPDKEVS